MSEPRKSNKILNQKPKFVNFIPQELAIPMLSSVGVGFLLNIWFSVNAFLCVGIALWLGLTYWLYVGDKPHIHIAKLTMRKPTWGTAQAKYKPRDDLKIVKRK